MRPEDSTSDSFGEDDKDGLDYDDRQEATAQGNKMFDDFCKRELDQLNRQPPTAFHFKKLPPEHVWQFIDMPQNQRWKRIPGNPVRMLLPENLDSEFGDLVNDRDSPLLLVGPTGAGKDIVAGLIHHLGSRKGRPFVKIGASAVSDQLMVTRFHGYQKNAHSMAHEEVPGLFREADGGTLVLDDIDLNRNLQQLMLTFMDDLLAKPEGGRRIERRVDVRLIATTNQDPDDEAHLRPDLRQRFDEPLRVPLLAERDPVDVAMLLQEYLRKSGALKAISIRLLLSAMWHPWPGNIRQLGKYCERIVRRFARKASQPEILDEAISRDMALPSLPTATDNTPTADDPRVAARRLLYANLNQDMAHRIEEGSVETANSLMLLAHLAADIPSAEGYSLHPAVVPLRRLETPDSFPPCYESIPRLRDDASASGRLNLVEFLACIVRLSRRTQHTEDAELRADVPSQEWLKWLTWYPRPLVPDYMAMGASAHTSSRHAIPRADASADGSLASTGPSPSHSRDAGTSHIRQRRPTGRSRTITDKKLVEILLWADELKRADRFTENMLWRKFRDEAGRDVYGDHEALSERVRRIKDPELKRRAKEFVGYLFGTIA